MPRFPFRSLFLILLLSSKVSAASVTLNLNQVADNLKPVNAFDLDPAKPLPRKGGLLELKWVQFHKEWMRCRDLAAKLQSKQRDVEGWVAMARLECAMGAALEKKDVMLLESSVDSVRGEIFREKSWGNPLRDAWAKASMMLADGQVKKNPVKAQARYEAILENSNLSEDQASQALAGLGTLANLKKDDERALFFFRQSEEHNANRVAESKITEILERRNPTEKKEKSSEIQGLGAEAEAEPEIEKLLAEGKRAEAVKKSVETLNRFPAGFLAKKNKERIQDLLVTAVEANSDPELPMMMMAVKEAEATRLAEWAALLHRHGDDRAALELAEKALETMATTGQALNTVWVAGRAASFLGETEKATFYFDRLIQFYSSSDEAVEAAFRLGLVQIHLGNYQTAARYFEKVIAQNKPRWDLSARYWRVRALEKVDAKKAEALRDDLIGKFPLTYYGLRLRAEANKGVLEFPKADRSPLENQTGQLILVGTQKKAWDRFKKLSEEGWLLEAQAELHQIPMPAEPWALMQWGKILAKAGQYSQAIVAINRAMDLEETLRLPRYLVDAFPKAYDRWIGGPAQKFDLSPTLVRSLIRQESAFSLKALSTSSAMGLMQLIPPTAQDVAKELKMDVVIPNDLYRPDVNVPMGTSYLAKMLRQFNGSVPFALAAYNAGPHRIERFVAERPELQAAQAKDFSSWEDEIWYDELPTAETSYYVKAILRNVLLNRLIDQGPVTVTPAFWADLRHFSASRANDEVKRR